MWERGWVLLLLSVLAFAANLGLGNGAVAAVGAGVAVLVFGELAWRFTARRQPPARKRSGGRPKLPIQPGDVGTPPTHHGGSRRRERWEWVAEVGAGIATMALGLGALALPERTPIIGSPSWVGLGLTAIGLAICLLSTGTYFLEHVGRR